MTDNIKLKKYSLMVSEFIETVQLLVVPLNRALKTIEERFNKTPIKLEHVDNVTDDNLSGFNMVDRDQLVATLNDIIDRLRTAGIIKHEEKTE
jgi:lantibiotic modifying enzyme